ncbi:MAG: multiheme c-type cytochrome [Acidobacteriota bacterium]
MKKIAGIVLALSFLILFIISTSSAEPTEIGAEKCAKMCHKSEYENWLKTKHATMRHKVDCESCHGKGSEYAKMWIMKDKEAAKAAGLVAKPDKASCINCHKTDFKEEMLKLCH